MALAVALALVAGCAEDGTIRRAAPPSSAADRPTTTDPGPETPDEVDGFRPAELDWSRCDTDREADCATLEVPLDWADPTGPTIGLAVARRRATGSRIGSLVTNPGGPGGSGVDLVLADSFGPTLRERFDVVGWDPRGVGDSAALTCGDEVPGFLTEDPSPDDEAEQRAIEAAARAVAEECGTEDEELLPHVGTDSVARDLEALRIALGDRRLTYLGFSYGTLIGLRYLARFPTHARAIVLDGVVDPTLDLEGWLLDQTRAIDASLERAFESCGGVDDCPVDDLAAAYDEVAAAVERQPLPAGRGRRLGPAELATGAVYVSYDPAGWPDLTEAVVDALGGDGTAMADLAQGYYDLSGFTAYAAVTCTDSRRPVGAEAYAEFAEEAARISPRFGPTVANELLPCAFWPVPPAPVTGPVRAEGAPPVLVLGNRGDAATPYENSVKVAEMLEDGHLVSNDDEGHTAYGRSRCVDAAVHRYLIDLEVPERDPDCGR